MRDGARVLMWAGTARMNTAAITLGLALLVAFSRPYCVHAQFVEIPELVGGQTFNITGVYPEVGDVDQVWITYQPVELIVRSFKIDIQSGDFVILSKYPLEWDSGAGKPKLPLPPREYNLLVISDAFVNEYNTTVQLVNPDGVAVYFHGAKAFQREEFQEGVWIEVGLIDKTEPDPSTTTENIIPTPEPGVDEYYVSKFIIGSHPNQFLRDLNTFKRDLARMTNAYCAAKGITLADDAREQDVSVPTSSLRYCDRSWPPYDICVEASFAVAVYESGDGSYVMNAPRLNEMWADYAASHGYINYEPPSGPEISEPALWLTVFLGFILVLLPILCVLWLKKWSDGYQRDSAIFDAVSTMTDGTRGIGQFYDRENPVYKAPRRREAEARARGEGHAFDNLGFDNAPVYRHNSLYDDHLRREVDGDGQGAFAQSSDFESDPEPQYGVDVDVDVDLDAEVEVDFMPMPMPPMPSHESPPQQPQFDLDNDNDNGFSSDFFQPPSSEDSEMHVFKSSF